MQICQCLFKCARICICLKHKKSEQSGSKSWFLFILTEVKGFYREDLGNWKNIIFTIVWLNEMYINQITYEHILLLKKTKTKNLWNIDLKKTVRLVVFFSVKKVE